MTLTPLEGYLTDVNILRVGQPAVDMVVVPVQEAQTAVRNSSTSAYDSVWAGQSVPTQQATGVEALLLKEDKLYTVLAVVLIIWFGIMFFIVRTDRKLDRLEKSQQ